MTDQLALELVPLEPIPHHPDIQESFEAFHQANPSVYHALVTLARQLHGRGRTRVGIGALFERLRWEWWTVTDDPTSDYHLNNNFRSRYARLIMANEADLDGLFEIRTLTS